MSSSNRRVFMLQVAAGGFALALAKVAHAEVTPLVNEKDAQAVSLGCAADSTKVDAKKYPKHAATRLRSN